MDERWIWPFELLEKIGEGGMGVVYRARCVTNDKMAAVKLLPEAISSDKTLVARFEREMSVLKDLTHPHIVHCYGGVSKGKRRYYAMELVDGGSLQQRIKKQKRLTWNQAVKYTIQICSGLQCAHEHGIIHRDMKPANFLLTKTGQLKISDFGIAYVNTATKITAAGKTVGSYHYMAPEQIRGDDSVCARTDLYGVGCVLFEMLTGRPPFQGDTAAAILHQHIETPPPSLAEMGVDCPDPTFAGFLVNSLLEKSIDKRPESAQTVVDWLNASKRTQAADVKKSKGRRAGATSSSKSRFSTMRQRFAKWSGQKTIQRLGVCALIAVAASGWYCALYEPARTEQDSSRSISQAENLWIDAFRSKDVPLRVAAAQALGEIGRDRKEVITILRTGLFDPSSDVRQAAVLALGNLGGDAQSAITPLLRLQRMDASPTIRRQAGEALAKIRHAPSSP